MEFFGIALIWLGLFAAAFFAWYYFLQARTKERTLLIEKGADASNFYGKKPDRKGFCFPWLKFGLLLVGISLGITLATILVSLPSLQYKLQDMEPGVFFGLIMFFGGISMIVAHITDKKKVQ